MTLQHEPLTPSVGEGLQADFSLTDIQQWLDGLPYADPEHAVMVLGDFFDEIQFADLSARQKFEIFEAAEDKIVFIKALLRKHFLGKVVIGLKRQDRSLDLLQHLNSFMLSSYEMTLYQYQDEGENDPTLLAQIYYRKMLYLYNLLQGYYFERLSIAPEHWQAMVTLYEDARSAGVARQHLHMNHKQTSVTHLYKMALLFQKAMPASLSQEDMERLLASLPAWSNLAEVTADGGVVAPELVAQLQTLRETARANARDDARFEMFYRHLIRMWQDERDEPCAPTNGQPEKNSHSDGDKSTPTTGEVEPYTWDTYPIMRR